MRLSRQVHLAGSASPFRFDAHSSCTNAAGDTINGHGGWCTAAGGRGWMIFIGVARSDGGAILEMSDLFFCGPCGRV